MDPTRTALIWSFSAGEIGLKEEEGSYQRDLRRFLKWTAAAWRICSAAAGSAARRRTARGNPGESAARERSSSALRRGSGSGERVWRNQSDRVSEGIVGSMAADDRGNPNRIADGFCLKERGINPRFVKE